MFSDTFAVLLEFTFPLYVFLFLAKYVRNTWPWNGLFSHNFHGKSLSPCFWDDTTDLKNNKKKIIFDPISNQTFMWNSSLRNLTYFVAGPNLHFRSLCHRSMETSTAQKSSQCLLHQCFNFGNITLNMAIGIPWKIDLDRL